MVFSHLSSSAQYGDVYPSGWWTGMKTNKVQLLIRGTDADLNTESISINYPGVKILKRYSFENGKYIALDIVISPDAKPGSVAIICKKGTIKNSIPWQLKPRRKGNGTLFAQGANSADFIYLAMPDRFSNGDESNDAYADMKDTASDRNNPFLRHGGDLQGIINHLDYLNELGVTALWLTPVVENDQPLTNEGGTMRSSYHGYGFTNPYKIDKRYGGNAGYKLMIDAAHNKGLKIIQDVVYNHVGNNHFLFVDPPAKDWFNQWPTYTNTSYKDQALVDPYASKSDFEKSVSGWFTPFLPDLNQRNPFVEKFLIQNAIWSVEEFGIDGWRIDTYFYSDRNFLNRCNKALLTEYPHISIFGETWVASVTEQAYFAANTINSNFKSNLPGVTDFQWTYGALAGLNEEFGWSNGINKLYNTLIQDRLYKNPMNNVLFLDNHDFDRFYSVVGEDFNKYKMGITLLFTQRGLPQLYYGTEILMKNYKDPSDAEVRRDFPGGFKGDSADKFKASGRTSKENEAFNFVSTLANFRKNSSAIKTGKFMQYIPVDGLYIYFRYDEKQTVLCAVNTSSKEITVNLSDYAERTRGFNTARDIQTGNIMGNSFTVAANSGMVAELSK